MKRIKYSLQILLTGLALILSTGTSATQQILEQLELETEQIGFLERPFRSHPDYKHVVKTINSDGCTSNWRGYVGIWKIQQNKLYLTHFIRNACGNERQLIPATKLLKSSESEVFASWYSGNITYNLEDCLGKYSLTGACYLAHRARVYKIENGKVISQRVHNFEEGEALKVALPKKSRLEE